MAEAPPLSVIIGTSDAGDEFDRCLTSIREQALAVGGEVIVADGRPEARDHVEDGVTWVAVPRASVFAQRAAGIARATGDVVAVTEDHCWARPGWCEAILRAHAEHPDVGVVTGALENGATEHAVDRAIFAIAASAVAAPMGPEVESTPMVANLSVKRQALDPAPSEGWLELIFTRDAWIAGDIVCDDRMRVVHEKSLRPLGPYRAVFHNARSSSGLVVGTLSPTRRARRLARAVLVMPFSITATTIRRVRTKPALRRDPGAYARIPLLAVVHTAGEITGLLRGPGGSPEEVV